MGRPKGSKNKKTLELQKAFIFQTKENVTQTPTETPSDLNISNEDNVTTVEEKKSVKTAIKPGKTYEVCDKCKTNIYCSPIRINLSHLTGQATWHRRCKLDQLKLCNACAKELNELIDNWILKDHPEYIKWDI